MRPRRSLRRLWWLAVAVTAACARPAPVEPATVGRPAAPAAATLAAASPPDAPHEQPAAVERPSPWESADDGAPRIGSVRWVTHIFSEPNRADGRIAIGSIRIGTTLRLKSDRRVQGPGCPTGFVEVEPFGWVCADGTTTQNFDSPYWRALASVTPRPGALPYRYAYSMGAPMYARVPTPEEQDSAERWSYGPPRTFASQGKWAHSHEVLVQRDATIEATDPRPDFFAGHELIEGSPYLPGRVKLKTIPAGSGLAYARAFEAEGRVWLLTPELLLVPADRVFPFAVSDFHGQVLGEGVELPLAWVRAADGVPRFALADDHLAATDSRWPAKTAVPLTGESRTEGELVFHRTHDGHWLREDDGVAVVRAVTELPGPIVDGEKWIDARILPGYLVAYVGLRPVFTTLWSGGKGGAPVRGLDPKRYATTEVGIFTFEWKERVQTMSPDKGPPTVFWFADVPHVQYVHAPLALHVTYWHDNFGHLMSAECMNVSPEDGLWLEEFTDPPLPPGWNAVRHGKLTGPASRVVIRPR